MPSIFAPQAVVTNDTGAVTLGFQGAPNVLYDRTMVGNTTYTISTAGTTGGETMAITLRGLYAYSFESSAAINWADQAAPMPQCSALVFDRIKFEVLQDGSLLGMPQAMGAGALVVAPVHYLNVNALDASCYTAPTVANDGSDNFISISEWINLTSAYAPSQFAPLVARWYIPGGAASKEYIFGLAANGEIQLSYFDSNGNQQNAYSTTPISAALANPAGIWLRIDCNCGASEINGVPPGTAIFYTAKGGSTPQWTQLGSQVTASQTGLLHIGSNFGILIGDYNQAGWSTNTGKVYKVIIQNSTTILANPNFTLGPTTASGGTFTDTAPTPNVFSLGAPIV